MSKIIWSHKITPAADTPVVSTQYKAMGANYAIPNTRALPVATTDIPLPDRRAYRSMSRAAVLLYDACKGAIPHMESALKDDPFSVGIYCAVEVGPTDYDAASLMADAAPEAFAEAYKKNFSPKAYLRRLPNLAAAQLGIFLNAMGPMNIYNHAEYSGVQALEQAEVDVESGLVKLALVCTAMSLEDPILSMRLRHDRAPEKIISEGAAALLLSKNGEFRSWEKLSFPESREDYGMSQFIINVVKQEG